MATDAAEISQQLEIKAPCLTSVGLERIIRMSYFCGSADVNFAQLSVTLYLLCNLKFLPNIFGTGLFSNSEI